MFPNKTEFEHVLDVIIWMFHALIRFFFILKAFENPDRKEDIPLDAIDVNVNCNQ